MSFTEETLKRFYADKIQCILCGNFISKKEMPTYEKGKDGHIIRKWRCWNCITPFISVFYSEDVTELQKLGLL